jgi:hypothetical protein
MWVLIPIGAFVFVLGGLGAVARIHKSEDWLGTGIMSALGFAGMMFGWMNIVG